MMFQPTNPMISSHKPVLSNASLTWWSILAAGL